MQLVFEDLLIGVTALHLGYNIATLNHSSSRSGDLESLAGEGSVLALKHKVPRVFRE